MPNKLRKKMFSTEVENVILARLMLRKGTVPKKFEKRNLDIALKTQRKLLA